MAPPAKKTTEVVSPEADKAANLTIIRIGGEMTTKAPRTRQRYQQAMRRNLVEALNRNGIAHSLDMVDARLLLRTEDRAAALGLLPRVFGLGSLSPVEAITDATVEAIVRTGREIFADQVRGKRYAVRCKRIGPRTFSALDVERQLGAALNDGATVDLTNPEITVRAEVFGGHAYLFAGRHIGASGLPPGIHGRTLALISDGFDSAVAAWRLMRRGAAVVSDKHCNFLVNEGGATATDLEGLGEEVRRRVEAHSGVVLEWEVRRIGRMPASELGEVAT